MGKPGMGLKRSHFLDNINREIRWVFPTSYHLGHFLGKLPRKDPSRNFLENFWGEPVAEANLI
jgi:hypothetical protein